MWLTKITNGHFTHFENLKTHGADAIIFSKMLKFVPRTHDPSNADIFLVPLFGGLDAILGWGHGLSRINPEAHHNVLNWDTWATHNLPHWRRVPHRHVILFNMNSDQVPSGMTPATVLHLGPTITHPHHIIVPYLILERPFFVPHKAEPRSIFAYVQMTPSRNWIRRVVARQLSGVQGVVVDTHIIGESQKNTIRHMRKSVFCIAPSGDSASYCTRLYFALLSGCIPVRIDSYNSQDAYPYVGDGETLRDLIVKVSPNDIRWGGLMNILRNVTDIPYRLQRIRNIQSRLRFDPNDEQEEDAFTMILFQLLDRKTCADAVVSARSLFHTHVGTQNDCSLPEFNLTEEMC